MFKQLLLIIIISILAVLFATELHSSLQYLGTAQNLMAGTITTWFPISNLTALLSRVIAVILLPFLISYVSAFIYWLVKRRELPYLKQIVGALWIVSLLIFIYYK